MFLELGLKLGIVFGVLDVVFQDLSDRLLHAWASFSQLTQRSLRSFSATTNSCSKHPLRGVPQGGTHHLFGRVNGNRGAPFTAMGNSAGEMDLDIIRQPVPVTRRVRSGPSQPRPGSQPWWLSITMPEGSCRRSSDSKAVEVGVSVLISAGKTAAPAPPGSDAASSACRGRRHAGTRTARAG